MRKIKWDKSNIKWNKYIFEDPAIIKEFKDHSKYRPIFFWRESSNTMKEILLSLRVNNIHSITELAYLTNTVFSYTSIIVKFFINLKLVEKEVDGRRCIVKITKKGNMLIDVIFGLRKVEMIK